MATSSLTIQIDDDLKRKAETLFSEAGLNVTSALQKYLEKCVNDGHIPIEVIDNDPDYDDELFYSCENQVVLGKSIKDFEDGNTVTIDLDELIMMSEKALNNHDVKLPTFEELREKNIFKSGN